MARFGFGNGMTTIPRSIPGEAGEQVPVFTPTITDNTPGESGVDIAYSGGEGAESIDVVVSLSPGGAEANRYNYVPEGPSIFLPWGDLFEEAGTTIYIKLVAVKDSGTTFSPASNEIEVTIYEEIVDAWRDFTVTTGAVSELVFGYHASNEVGSINREPNNMYVMNFIYYRTEDDTILAQFAGDVSAALETGFDIKIDGVAYPKTVNFIFGNTEVLFDVSEGTPWNAAGQDHTVEFDAVVTPQWQTFFLTAGNVLDVYTGFLVADALGNPSQIGSVSPAPNTVYVTRGIIDAGAEGYIVQVFGDHAAELTGLVLEINGIKTVRSTEAIYIEADDYTNVAYNSEVTDRFVVDGMYVCNFVTPDPA